MKVMTFLTGKIRVAITEEENAAQQTGKAAIMKRQRVDCKVCSISLAAESLQSHLETQHDIYRLFVPIGDSQLLRFNSMMSTMCLLDGSTHYHWEAHRILQ